jgi:hypothetical protein
VRQAATILIAAALIFAAPSAQADGSFDGPQAAGATFGAGVVTGIACWTFELAQGEVEEPIPGEVREDFDRRGWFAGLEGVYGYQDFKVGDEESDIRETYQPFDVDFNMDSDSGGGLNFKVGRRCHSRVAVEFEVEWIDKFKGTIKEPTAGDVTNVKFSPIVVTTVNVKGYLLTGRYQPYALLGVGMLALRSASSNVTDGPGKEYQQDTGMLALRFGGGIDVYATRNWVVTGGVDYVYSATNIDHMNYISVGVGVQYRF